MAMILLFLKNNGFGGDLVGQSVHWSDVSASSTGTDETEATYQLEHEENERCGHPHPGIDAVKHQQTEERNAQQVCPVEYLQRQFHSAGRILHFVSFTLRLVLRAAWLSLKKVSFCFYYYSVLLTLISSRSLLQLRIVWPFSLFLLSLFLLFIYITRWWYFWPILIILIWSNFQFSLIYTWIDSNQRADPPLLYFGSIWLIQIWLDSVDFRPS